MMKKLLALALALVTAFSVTACAPKEKTAVNVYTIAGPTGVGMVKLMKDNEDQNTKNNYTFSVESSPEAVVSKIINGEADIAAVPTNLASTLYKKTEKKVEILAVNTLGVLYILENGDTVTDINSLKGKTIYSTGEGANPEYILKYILEKNGILNDVKIEFLAENEELAAKMISGDVKLAMVPQPTATSIMLKNDAVKSKLDVTAEWEKAAGTNNLMMGGVIVRKEFLEQNEQAVKDFMEEYEASINYVNSNVDDTAALCETYKIVPSAALAKAAIPQCNVTFISGEDMKTGLSSYLQVLYDADKTSVGGELPDDGFYYTNS